MAQEVTGSTNRKTDGNVQTPFSNKNFHVQFLDLPIKQFHEELQFQSFYDVATPKKKRKKNHFREKQVGKTQELWQSDRRLIIVDRY